MKRWLAVVVLALVTLPARAQLTNVTATVMDTAGTLYVNCTFSVVFVGQNTTPGAGPYQPAPLLVGQSGLCDSAGRMTVTLADNINTVRPTPSQWNFSICSQPYTNPAATYCRSNMLVTVTGTTQDLTTHFQPLMPILPPAGGGGGGGGGGSFITDATPLGGLMKTGTTLGMQTTCTIGQNLAWSGSAWVCANPGASTGGGTSVLVNGVQPIPNSLNFNSTTPIPPGGTQTVQWLLNGNNVLGYITGGGGGGSLTVNGGPGGTNLSDQQPPIPPNGLNVSWQAAAGNISAALVGDGIATHCFLGTGVFAVCPSSGGGGGATLPTTPQYDLFASTGAGAAQASGVLANNAHILTQVIKAIGGSATSPFQAYAGGTMEYFPGGAIFPPSSTNFGATNGFYALFSHSGNAGAAGNGGIGLAGGNTSGTAYQVYLDCEATPAPGSCNFLVPPLYNGSPIGGGTGGTVPGPQFTVLTSNGAGSMVSGGVSAQSGFLEGNVLQAIGASGPSPFTPANASIEYFPTGAYGVGATNGAGIIFSHSANTGATGNGGVALAGGNASGANYQVYEDCEMVACSFLVPIVLPKGTSTAGAQAMSFAVAPDIGIWAGPQANQMGNGALVGFVLNSVTRATNVVTGVTATSTGMPVGSTIQVSGVTDSSYNGTFRVASISGSSITWNQTGTNGSSTGGLISPWMQYSTAYANVFNHLQSSSNSSATRGSIRLGPSDNILYGCPACTNSIVTGNGTSDQNLLSANNNLGAVKLGDYQGVSIPGALTVSGNLTTNISGTGPFCVQASNGVLSSSGAACGTGSGGHAATADAITSTGTQGQFWGYDPTGITGGQGWFTPLATGLTTTGGNGQVWGVTSGGAQGWITPASGGGSGTIATGAIGQFPYYAAAGNTIVPSPRLSEDTGGTTLTYSGSALAATHNVNVGGLLTVAGPWLITTSIPTGTGMGAAPAGQSSMGINLNGGFYISNNGAAPAQICTATNNVCAGATFPPAGIPLSTGTAWGSSFNTTSNQIPGTYVQVSSLPTVPSATTATSATSATSATTASTATALASTTPCAAGSFTSGINASGVAQNCTNPGSGLSFVTGTPNTWTTVGNQPYEIAITVNSTFTASQVFLRKPTSVAYTIPTNCAGSYVVLTVAPATPPLVLTLAKNGTQFGTVSITSLGGSAVWTCTATSFAVGTDVLTVTAPATPDTAAANFGGSILATR